MSGMTVHAIGLSSLAVWTAGSAKAAGAQMLRRS
jgi:hypothetical protein